jgi:hypothetical protein
VTRIICSALLVLAAMAAHGGATDKPGEEYGYENQHRNAPLTDADFDPKNPEYHF